MGYAVILNNASKAGTTGGTFADSLTATTNSSLSIANFVNGGARIPYMWGIDSDSVAELEILLTRYISVHDQQHGQRVEVPAIALGGAGTNAAFTFIGPDDTIPVESGDTMTLNVTTTAGDDFLASFLVEYDDLPGVKATFGSPEQVFSMRETQIGLNNLPVASGTAGGFGTQRALNADDTRLSANKYYAILGCTVQTQVTTIALQATTWGGQMIGLPVGALDLNNPYWFVALSRERGRPLIPVINANDAGNVLVSVSDGEASTSPKVDWNMLELSGPIPGLP